MTVWILVGAGKKKSHSSDFGSMSKSTDTEGDGEKIKEKAMTESKLLHYATNIRDEIKVVVGIAVFEEA